MWYGPGAAMSRCAWTANAQTKEGHRQFLIAFFRSHVVSYAPIKGEMLGISEEMNADFEKALSGVEEKGAQAASLHDDIVASKNKEVQI